MDVRSAVDVRTGSGALHARAASSLEARSASASGPAEGAANRGEGVVAPPPFLSPVYKYDALAKLSIYAIRDVSSGEVKTQFPAQKVVEQYRRNRLQAAQQAEVVSAAVERLRVGPNGEAGSTAEAGKTGVGGQVPSVAGTAVTEAALTGAAGAGSGERAGNGGGTVAPAVAAPEAAPIAAPVPVAPIPVPAPVSASPVASGGAGAGAAGRIVSIKV